MRQQHQPSAEIMLVNRISRLIRRLEADEQSLRSSEFTWWKSYRVRARRIEDKFDDLLDELQELLDEVIV